MVDLASGLPVHVLAVLAVHAAVAGLATVGFTVVVGDTGARAAWEQRVAPTPAPLPEGHGQDAAAVTGR